MVRFRTVLAAALLASTLIAANESAENWPQWRGPGRQEVSPETQLPTGWTPERNIVWRTELAGGGHSSPIVWGDRVFITSVVEGDVVEGATALTHARRGKRREPGHRGG